MKQIKMEFELEFRNRFSALKELHIEGDNSMNEEDSYHIKQTFISSETLIEIEERKRNLKKPKTTAKQQQIKQLHRIMIKQTKKSSKMPGEKKKLNKRNGRSSEAEQQVYPVYPTSTGRKGKNAAQRRPVTVFQLQILKLQVSFFKNNKAPGLDNIPAESIKADRDTVANMQFDIFGKIWEKEKEPSYWKKTCCKTKQKGKPQYLDNYRQIMLLSVP